MGRGITFGQSGYGAGATKGVGLAHAKTGPLADRGGDTSTISRRRPGVNRPRRGEMKSIGFAAMSTSPRAASVRPIEPSDLDAAARLLADRHRRHRLAEPLLDAAYEDPAAARREIEALLAGDRADGWTALRDGQIAGYLVGVSKAEASWGPNVWVAAAAKAWVDAGRLNQHVLVPASDPELVEAWFNLDFGTQHLHAVREVPHAS